MLDTHLRTPPMHKLPVVPICRMHIGLLRRANHNDALAHPASMKRDVSADRHDTWGGDAMDAEARRTKARVPRSTKPCGPDTPMLVSTLRAQEPQGDDD